jgi:redox-sensitive bicupin YhaK (pirin superfamily)
MLTIRPAAERGRTRLDWLDSWHTFSFGDYFDSRHMGFGPLRVINDDRVEPGRGFGTHGHRDMEILTWILDGELEHRDSLGTGSVIRPGEVQIMSAGTGIEHSEFNPSPIEPVHLLQIWMIPERRGLPPRYDQQAVSLDPGTFHQLAGGRPGEGAVRVFQDIAVYVARLDGGQRVEHPLGANRAAWLHVARGAVTLDGRSLRAGDGVAVTREDRVAISGDALAEVILFDLAAASV